MLIYVRHFYDYWYTVVQRMLLWEDGGRMHFTSILALTDFELFQRFECSCCKNGDLTFF